MAFNMQQMRAIQQYFASQRNTDDGLVTFRAGRLFLDESTRMVSADKKRGKIKFTKDEQGLLHLEYYNRISSQKELDLTIFPQSAKWEKVNDCKDGRVYVLRMIQNNRKHFFWMQEPKDDKDEEYFTNVNKLCNGENIAGDASAAAAGGAGGSAANRQQQSILQSLGMGGMGAGGGGGAAAAGGNAQNNLTQMIMDAMNRNTGGTGNNNQPQPAQQPNAQQPAQNNLLNQMANMMQQQQQAQRQAMEELKREPDLEDILDPTANQEIMALLDDEKNIEELAQHLPESMRTRQDIIEQLQSPQFQGSLRRLQSAINGPQMPTLLSQMQVQSPNQNAMGVRAFINAIQPGAAPPIDSSKENEDDKNKENDKDKEVKKEKDDKNKDDDGDANMTDKSDDKDKGDNK
eukprot:437643_1